MNLISLGIILLFGFLIRLPFTLLSPLSSTNDGSGTFSKLNALSKHLLPKLTISDAANHSGYFPRPNLFHWLVSRFPKKLWRIIIVLGNILPDLVLGLILYGFLPFVFPEMTEVFRQLLVLILITSPIFFPFTARLKATNGRTVGFLLASSYLLLMPVLSSGLLGIEPLYLYLMLAVLAFLTFWTSTFASQTIIFVSFIYSALNFSFFLLMPIVFVLGLSFAFRTLGIWDMLLFKIHHTKFYSSILMSSFSTRERSLFNFWKVLNPKLSRSARLDLILKHSPVLISLYSIPILFPIIYFVAPNADSLDMGNGIFGAMNSLTLSILVVFVLTSISVGKIFGEAERYLEYAVFPLLLLLASFLLSDPNEFFLVFLGLIQLSVVILVTILNWKGALEKILSFERSIPTDIEDLVEFVQQHDSESRILCVPFRASRLMSSAAQLKSFNGLKYYYQLVVSGDTQSDYLTDSINEMFGQNCPSKSTDYFQKKYGITLFVVEQKFLLDGDFKVSLAEKCTQVVQIGPYELYKFI